MEKLNVYKNYLKGSYCAGLLLVAAHSKEEAHEVCWNSSRLESSYWEFDLYGMKDTPQFEHYSKDGFELIPNLTYEGEPCVIEERHYIE